jgi:predicted cation transporter
MGMMGGYFGEQKDERFPEGIRQTRGARRDLRSRIEVAVGEASVFFLVGRPIRSITVSKIHMEFWLAIIIDCLGRKNIGIVVNLRVHLLYSIKNVFF